MLKIIYNDKKKERGKMMEFLMKEAGFYTTTEYGDLHIAGDDVNGFRPYQLLVSSIIGCSGSVLRQILMKKRIEIEDIAITAQVERNKVNANRIDKIHIHYRIKGENLHYDKILKSVELASKICPMAQAVKGNILIEETFELE
jgi:putative redox protein